MGLLDDLDQLNLSDEQKEIVRQKHAADLAEKDTEIQTLKSKDRRDSVEQEVEALGGMFSDPQPGLLKFVRRVYLSDDEEPGLVMLSDSDLNLSGDSATGSTTREEITTAGVLRKFISLLPQNQEGKINLSDQGIAADDHGRPEKDGDESDDDQEAAEQARRERVRGLGIKLRPRDGEEVKS